jgi:non-heme Fe2+,alpha-ketoglutarate-dependent halogenase
MYSVEDFDKNGFAGPILVLSAKEAQKARNEVVAEFGLRGEHQNNNFESSSGNHKKLAQGNHRFKVHLFLPEMNRIVHNPTLLDAVRKALGTPHVALWSSDLCIKLPQTKNYFSSHQDATYTGLEPAHKCLTAWVALSDPVGIQEGCLSFHQGSHKDGQLPHEEFLEEKKDVNNMLSRGQRVITSSKNQTSDATDLQQSSNSWVKIPLRWGEATLHHFHTIHSSGPNQHPTQSRIGLALRYLALGVQQTGPIREFVTWIRPPDDAVDSKDEAEKKRLELEQSFDLEPQLPLDNPNSADIEAGRRAHEEAMRREAGNYFHDSTNVTGYDEIQKDSKK